MGARDGKVAAVTGAASGMGRATALLFARGGARTELCPASEQSSFAIGIGLLLDGGRVAT